MRTLLLLITLLPCYSLAQLSQSDYDFLNCSYSFSVDANSINHTEQTTFYASKDQFSFWYKIKMRSTPLKLTIISNNGIDTYSPILFLSENDDNFCHDVLNGKLRPLKLKDLQETSKSQSFTLSGKPNTTFYLCVLNTSLNNCGHTLLIENEAQVSRIKAVHFPCERDSTKLVGFKPTSKQQAIKPTIVPSGRDVMVLDKNTGEPLKFTIAVWEETTGKKVIPLLDTTAFKFPLQKSTKYKVKIQSTGYKKDDKTIEFADDTTAFITLLEPLKSGDHFVLNDIYFHPNTYALKKESKKEIEKLVEYLKKYDHIVIELQGHTNGNNKIYRNKAYKGLDKEWNFKGSSKKLSLLRAEELKKLITSAGVNENKIKTVGYGGNKMIVKNPRSLEQIQKNVRVEVKIISSKD